jgi:hypothetical protein
MTDSHIAEGDAQKPITYEQWLLVKKLFTPRKPQQQESETPTASPDEARQ